MGLPFPLLMNKEKVAKKMQASDKDEEFSNFFTFLISDNRPNDANVDLTSSCLACEYLFECPEVGESPSSKRNFSPSSPTLEELKVSCLR